MLGWREELRRLAEKRSVVESVPSAHQRRVTAEATVTAGVNLFQRCGRRDEPGEVTRLHCVKAFWDRGRTDVACVQAKGSRGGSRNDPRTTFLLETAESASVEHRPKRRHVESCDTCASEIAIPPRGRYVVAVINLWSDDGRPITLSRGCRRWPRDFSAERAAQFLAWLLSHRAEVRIP